MEIYNYDRDGFYLGVSDADESPLEEGVFLIPAMATTITPQVVDIGFANKFNGTEWEIIDISLELSSDITEPVGVPVTNAEVLAEQISIQQAIIDELTFQILELRGALESIIK